MTWPRRSGRSCRRLWLVTTNDNLPAVRFYQRIGLRVVAIHRDVLLPGIRATLLPLGLSGVRALEARLRASEQRLRTALNPSALNPSLTAVADPAVGHVPPPCVRADRIWL